MSDIFGYSLCQLKNSGPSCADGMTSSDVCRLAMTSYVFTSGLTSYKTIKI